MNTPHWPAIIQELQDSGLSQVQIAARCDSGQSHISGLLLGKRKQPGWKLGNALLALHVERTRHQETA